MTGPHGAQEPTFIPGGSLTQAGAVGAILGPPVADTGRPETVRPNIQAPVRHRRQPGEVPIRSAAIRSFCFECLGYDSDGAGSMAAAVRACTCRECHLWPWRNGPLDREGLAEEVPAGGGS